MTRLTPEQALAAAFMNAIKRRPYFAPGFAKLTRRLAPVGTMAVTKTGVLLADPERLAEWSTATAAEVVTHELLHILRRHADRAKLANADHGQWNVAADAEINDDLDRALLPAGVIYPEDIGAEAGGLAEQYYAKLTAPKPQPEPQPQPQPEPQDEDQDEDQDGESDKDQDGKDQDEDQDGNGSDEDEDQDGEDQDGNGSEDQDSENGEDQDAGESEGEGESEPSEGDVGKPSDADQDADQDAKASAKAGAGRCGSGAGGEELPEEKEYAGDVPPRSEIEMDRMRADVAREIQAHAAQHGQGSVPGGFLTWADQVLSPPKVRWQDKLTRIVRAAVETVAGKTDYARDRISRRQPCYTAIARARGGFAPCMPALVGPRPEVAIGIDTSGSMGKDELTRAVSEAQGVLKALGAPVTFLACDSWSTEPKQVKTARELAALMRGGGGTDFRPVFAAVEKLRPVPHVFIFITDGQGPAPEIAPKGFETIWVLVGRYAERPCDWGQQIRIEE